MTSQRVAAGSSDRLHYSYAHDGLGRVTSITDHVTAAESRAYAYDALGRLTTASGPWGAGSYTYDLLNAPAGAFCAFIRSPGSNDR